MAAAQKPGGAIPPSPPPPPPVPVSGITPARKAIAPSLTEEPKGLRPEQAFADRQKAAIAKATGEGQKQQDAAAGEDAAPPPKAKPAATAAEPATSGKAPTAAAAKAPASAEVSPSSSTATDGGKTVEAPKAVYDFASLKKWSEENPEDAAKLFKIPEDTRQEWIRLKNRERKVKENIRGEHEKTMAEARAERQAAEEARQAIDTAAGKLGPIADLWEAVAEKVAADPSNPQVDFEAADAAFLENAKISIDDYMRLRARRSIGSSSDAVRLRVENQKLKRELAGKPSDTLKTTAAGESTKKDEAATAPPAAAKTNARDWSGELDGKHKLKQLDGWNDMLDVEMRKYRDSDTDEYDADPNEIADKLLKREIARMMEDDPPADPPQRSRTQAAKPAQTRPVVKPRDSGDGVPSAASLTPRMTAPDDEKDEVQLRGGKKLTWSQIQNRAITRAQQRARGEIE